MKAIQSLLCAPLLAGGKASHLTGGWWSPKLHWYAWGLSVHRLRRFFPRVELVTDAEGARVLADLLDLPYDSVTIGWDDGWDVNGMWSLGKARAILLQREPFLHVDSDVWIKKPLPDHFLAGGVLVQSIDDPRSINFAKSYVLRLRLMRKYLPDLPPSYDLAPWRPMAYNTGVIGGSDLDSLQSFCREWLGVVQSRGNREGWSAISRHLPLPLISAAVEQYTAQTAFSCHAADVRTLFPDWSPAQRQRLADELGYCHVMGGKRKATSSYTRLLAKAVEREVPQLVEKVDKLLSS